MFKLTNERPKNAKVQTISEMVFNRDKVFYFCGLPIYLTGNHTYKVEKNVGAYRTTNNSINSETAMIKLPTIEIEGVLDFMDFTSYMQMHITSCLWTTITTNLIYGNIYDSGIYNTPLYYPIWDLLANLSPLINGGNHYNMTQKGNFFIKFMTNTSKAVYNNLEEIDNSDYTFMPELIGQYGEQLLAWISNTVLWLGSVFFDVNPQVTPIMQQALLDTVIKVTQTRRGRLWCIMPKGGFYLGEVSSISFSNMKNSNYNPIKVKMSFTQLLNNTYKE